MRRVPLPRTKKLLRTCIRSTFEEGVHIGGRGKYFLGGTHLCPYTWGGRIYTRMHVPYAYINCQAFMFKYRLFVQE